MGSLTCSICNRPHRGHLAEGSEDTCRGCVQTLATELEGFALVHCVCGGRFDYVGPDIRSLADVELARYECRECRTPAEGADYTFVLELATRR